MLPWKSFITLDRTDRRPIYLQISDRVIYEVMQGRLQQGLKMPGSRTLAGLLQVNRKTILQAYDELMAQGWLEIIPMKGTFIKTSLPKIQLKPLRQDHAASEKHVPIPSKYEVPRGDHVIDDGTPDYRLAPVDELLKMARFVAKGNIGKSILMGQHFFGEQTLRLTLARYLSETRAINGNADNLLVTRGSQMAIYLAFATLLQSGDQVLVGELNYQSADRAILQAGGQLRRVPVTDQGLDIDRIRQEVATHAIKAIYVTPHHHYPSTVTMPVAARMELLHLAEKYNFYIIEDDYDYDYHYARSPILPLASIDQTGKVIYIGSFSKILVPSIRMGYMYASEPIIQSCGQLRMVIDKLGDPIMERALAEMIRAGDIDRMLKKTILRYKDRRDLFCNTLKEKLGDKIDFVVPDGGMAVWVTFRNITIDRLIESAQKNKLVLKIDVYKNAIHSCRLGFASMNEKEILANTALLCQTIHELWVSQ